MSSVSRKWLYRAAFIVGAIGLMYLMIYIDVILRARHAYQEAEKAWTVGNYKDATTWYQTTIELFSPPESKWVKISRAKLPEAKARWRKQLEDQGIKVEDYMLE